MNSERPKVGDDILQSVIFKLNYTSVESFEKDLETLRVWTQKQPHFPEIMETKKIQNFLILNKGSVELAKQKIDNYYTVRSQLPDVFCEINPKFPYMETVLETCYVVPALTYTKDLSRVIYIKQKNKKLMENFNPIYGIRFLVNSQEIRLLEDVMLGEVFVVDGSDVPLSAVLNLTPTVVYKAMVVIYEKVFSIRLKGVYFINFPPFLDKLLYLLKAVMKPKLFSRIHVCHNYDILFEHLGKEVIPKDYGGDEKSFDELQERTRKKFRDYQEYFDKLDTLRVNESLRPEALKNDDMLGFHGNFKKLEVD